MLDTLSAFSGNPCLLASSQDEGWEAVNGVLYSTLEWNTPTEKLMKLICHGPLGVDGFVTWVERCLHDMGIDGGLLEGCLECMLEAVEQL